MKAFLYFLAFIYFIPSFAQTNQKDSKGKQGEWNYYYKDTILKSKGYYKNNKRIGVWHFYYETGEIYLEVEYLTDGITTNLKMYEPNGKKSAEGLYVNKKKEGNWYYYRDTIMIRTEPYKVGKLDGIVKSYYPSKKIFEEISFLNNKKEGTWKQFYENGITRAEGKFTNDTLSGKVTYYHPNGKKNLEGIYVKGLRNGTFYLYDESGKLIETLRYKKGRLYDEDEKRTRKKNEIKEYLPEDIIYKGGFEGLKPD
jgi:antitoxin component YwqK of YwqJK toxin-antitoxin module